MHVACHDVAGELLDQVAELHATGANDGAILTALENILDQMRRHKQLLCSSDGIKTLLTTVDCVTCGI